MRPIPIPSVRLVEADGTMAKAWYDWFREQGGGSTYVETIVAGTNVTVDATDPANPIVSAASGSAGVPFDWTPELHFDGLAVGITYDASTFGRGIKIDNLVHLWGYMCLTSKGSSTGAASIVGSPYVPAGTTELYAGTMSYYNNVTGVNDVGCQMISGTADIFPTTAGAALFWTDAEFANDTEMTFYIAFEAEP